MFILRALIVLTTSTSLGLTSPVAFRFSFGDPARDQVSQGPGDDGAPLLIDTSGSLLGRSPIIAERPGDYRSVITLSQGQPPRRTPGLYDYFSRWIFIIFFIIIFLLLLFLRKMNYMYFFTALVIFHTLLMEGVEGWNVSLHLCSWKIMSPLQPLGLVRNVCNWLKIQVQNLLCKGIYLSQPFNWKIRLKNCCFLFIHFASLNNSFNLKAKFKKFQIRLVQL